MLRSKYFVRWLVCFALIVAADLMMIRGNSRLQIQAQEPPTKDQKKKSPDELRKELEQKLKGIDINDPKFDEITKDYEQRIKEAIGRQPQPPIVQGPRDFRQLEQFQILPEFGQFPRKGRLGVVIEPLDPVVREQLDLQDNRGLVIREVTLDSVAEKIGLKVNDILVEFAGKPVPSNTQEFIQTVLSHKAEEETTIVVLRKGKKESFKGVKLPDMKQEVPPRLRGMLQMQQALPIVEAPALPPVPAIGGDEPKQALPLRIAPIAELENLDVRRLPLQSSMKVTNGQFELTHVIEGITYQINGKMQGKDKELKSIKIKEGDKIVEAESIEKLPENHRPIIQKMLDSIR